MKSSVFNLARTLHAWGGVTLTLLMMVVSLTGTLLIWKSEYLWLTEPAARVEFEPTPEALARIGAAVDSHFGDELIIGVRFATETLPLTQVILDNEQFAYLDMDGNVVDEWEGNGRAEEWLFDLHHRLLLGDPGLTFLGAAACAMLLLVIAGVIAFWPARRGWRQGVWPRAMVRPALLSSHRNLGIVVALPFALTLVTGITLAFPEAVDEWLMGEIRFSEEYSNAMLEGVDTIEGPESGEWQPAIERALAVFPGSVVRSAQVPGPFSAYRIISVQQPGEWNQTGLSRVYIDSTGGWMDLRMDSRNGPIRERLYNAATPLHTGRIGSLSYKLFLTLSGLGVFALSVLGLISFIKRYLRTA